MSDDRDARMREIFFEALDLEGPARDAFLERASAGDTALRAEVEALLDADAAAGRFLDPEIHAAGGHSEERVGARLGPYRLQAVIGIGGMGAVYVAERADEEFHKRVAVKILKRGMDTDDVLRRFRVERELLAQLEHPGIARLLDSGTTDDGLPYLVMEYVEGVPIDRYCAEHDLDIDQRIELFRAVCDVVRYAHHNLIVHRDLKPGNILVDGDGRVRLLDFGIAKVLDPSALPASIAVTRPDWRVFTPEYASPEQIRGGRVATASDTYSLGVLLYELLSGRRPYVFSSRTPSEVARLVCDTEPRKPSEVATRAAAPEADSAPTPAADAGGLRRRLAGDLDDIVMKALRKEPDRRYATVDELAEDLRRHQAGLPVTARGDTWTYRAAKYVRRHRLALGAGAAFVALLMVFAVVMSVQAARIALERDHAEREAQAANRTSFLIQRMLFSADPFRSRSDSTTVRELLDDATGYVRAELAGEPALQVRLLSVIARVRISHGSFDVADSLLKVAGGLAARSLERGSLDRARLDVARAELAARRGRMDEAKRLYAGALATFDRDHGSAWRERWNVRTQLGMVEMTRGEYDEASGNLQRSLAEAQTSTTDLDPEVAEVRTALAYLEYQRGRFHAALGYARDAVAQLERIYGPDHLKVLRALQARATILDDGFHDYAASLADKLRCLAIRRKRLGPDHPDVAIGMVGVGMSGYFTGDLRGAEDYLSRGDALAARVIGPVTPVRATAIGFLGIVHYAEGRIETSRSEFERALDIGRRSLPAGNRLLGTLEVYLGQAEYTLGRPAEGERHYRAGARILEEALGAAHRNTVWAYLSLASLLAAHGETVRADSLYGLARPGLDQRPDDPDLCYFAGGYWASRGDAKRAFEWLHRSIENGGQLQGAEYDPDLAAIRDRPDFARLIARRRPALIAAATPPAK